MSCAIPRPRSRRRLGGSLCAHEAALDEDHILTGEERFTIAMARQ